MAKLPESLRLTTTQYNIWTAIARFALGHAYGPSVRDIHQATGHSISTINTNLRVLQAKGYVAMPEDRLSSYRPARAVDLLVWPMEVIKKAG
jgi:DNA-binding MarR family transcriptional regulator